MIAVIGLGFVGLATALSFAENRLQVVGFDVDAHRMEALRAGQLPFHEPGLDAALKRHILDCFTLADGAAAAAANAETIFICVGTPADLTGAADLSHVLAALKAVLHGSDRKKFRTVVIKSTVPPGTTAGRIAPFLRELGWQLGDDIGLANNPEFLREGHAWADVLRPDRIVIGVEDKRSREKLEVLYRDFGAPIHAVSWNTAEFIKYLSNSLLATMISFANDASMIASAIGGVNIKEAFRILHQDRRWFGEPANMATYVFPGCGFGGYCLPKDTAALAAQARKSGYESPMLAATLAVNEQIGKHVLDHILQNSTLGKPIGILGLAFKPGSDDVRETPARSIVGGLVDAGFTVLAYDPLAGDKFRQTYGAPSSMQMNLRYANDLTEVSTLADPLVILTAWPEFRERRELFAGHTVLDFRYML